MCLEGHHGFFRGYCKHNFRPINDLISHLPPSLRTFNIRQKYLYIISSLKTDIIGNGALFNEINKQCPLLDSVHLSFDTRKMSSSYRDVGVLGLDGFSNILELNCDGNWGSLSTEEYYSFVSRNPRLTILDMRLDSNLGGNSVLLTSSRYLKVLRLRCGKEKHMSTQLSLNHPIALSQSSDCSDSMSYHWFASQPRLEYLKIHCDISTSIERFLTELQLLKSLRVLIFEKIEEFREEHFLSILASLESLEVRFVSLNI